MKIKLLPMLILILLIGCKNEKNVTNAVIADFSIDTDNYKPFEESGYQLSYEIIPLEFSDNSFIFNPQKVVMNDQYIYVIAGRNSFKVFDRQGNYRNTILNGKAGNELMVPKCMTIDEKNGNIEVLDLINTIKTYDSLGNYISSLKLDSPISKFEKIGNRYLKHGSLDKTRTTNFEITDGDQVHYFSEKYNSNPEMATRAPRITKYNGELYFIACYDNIVYKMGENDKEPIEYMILNNTFTDKEAKNISLLETIDKYENSKFISINSFMILDSDLVYIDAVKGKHSAMFLYDQSTGTPYQYPFPTSLYTSFPINTYNGKTIHAFNSSEFSNLKEEDFNSQSKALYAMIKERYEKYGTEENPYLILVSYNKKK